MPWWGWAESQPRHKPHVTHEECCVVVGGEEEQVVNGRGKVEGMVGRGGWGGGVHEKATNHHEGGEYGECHKPPTMNLLEVVDRCVDSRVWGIYRQRLGREEGLDGRGGARAVCVCGG